MCWTQAHPLSISHFKEVLSFLDLVIVIVIQVVNILFMAGTFFQII